MAVESSWDDDSDAASRARSVACGDPRLVIDIDGFEGPLDLLLDLARRQKVDLGRISILALVEQYLAFVATMRHVRLELAADYLVMAAWLAFLKSRFLLPHEGANEPTAVELAGDLAERLRRLEAIRGAARMLEGRPQKDREFTLRGAQDAAVLGGGPPLWMASMFELLSAYTRQRQKQALARVRVRGRLVWALADARVALETFIALAPDWVDLDGFVQAQAPSPALRRSVKASGFAVALEMVREGRLELRQDRAFGPLWMRPAPTVAAAGLAA